MGTRWLVWIEWEPLDLWTHLINRFLVHLHAVDGQSWTGVQFFMANVTFKVFRLLVLHEDLVIVEFTVAVPGRARERHGGKVEYQMQD